MKRTVFIVSTAVAVILGLDTIGGRPIAPGFDTGLTENWARRPEGRVLSLGSDAGDLECWLRLAVSGLTAPREQIRVFVGDVEGVAVAVCDSNEHPRILEVRGLPPASEVQGKFVWPSGRSVDIVFEEDGGSSPTLVDWAVYLKDEESDSSAKAAWRRTWFWISLVALVLSVAVALYTGLSKKPEIGGDPLRGCLLAMVDQVQGSNEKETEQMRSLLRRIVFEDASIGEVLEGLKTQTKVQSWQIWLKARNRFLTRLDALAAKLSDERKRLHLLDE